MRGRKECILMSRSWPVLGVPTIRLRRQVVPRKRQHRKPTIAQHMISQISDTDSKCCGLQRKGDDCVLMCFNLILNQTCKLIQYILGHTKQSQRNHLARSPVKCTQHNYLMLLFLELFMHGFLLLARVRIASLSLTPFIYTSTKIIFYMPPDQWAVNILY